VPRRRVLLPVVAFDRKLFDRVARSHTPWLDRVMTAATRAANYSRLWLVIAAALALTGRRRGQRAALRGLGSIALTSPVVNLVIKRLVRRPRPSLRRVPAARRLRSQPLTTSFPSGHAASAAAFAVGASSEMPRAAVPLGVLAGTVAYSRVYVGVHYPLDVVTGAALGAGVALLTRLQWPVLPVEADRLPPSRTVVRAPASTDGDGVSIVVNRKSGPGALLGDDPVELVRTRLPRAHVIQLEEPGQLEQALNDAAKDAQALGVYGGDGSAATAASVAISHGLPLLVLPGGTLNHLARDLRIESPAEALDALERGEAVRVDLAEIDGHPFVNTASFGGYTSMVDTRRRLERRIGRWPAHLVAVGHAVVTSRPVTVQIDGRRRRLWMAFIGNCAHEPAGFAPSWRPRLDDGLLDVRLLSGEVPLARARLLLSILSGRLTRSVAYDRELRRELHVTAPGPLRLARDGDPFKDSDRFAVRKRPKGLVIYAPPLPSAYSSM
jgi:diacylglycerol kinase family enzyme/membrane-associated phospholipid phosphatase